MLKLDLTSLSTKACLVTARETCVDVTSALTSS